jgi:hypothetical protein
VFSIAALAEMKTYDKWFLKWIIDLWDVEQAKKNTLNKSNFFCLCMFFILSSKVHHGISCSYFLIVIETSFVL